MDESVSTKTDRVVTAADAVIMIEESQIENWEFLSMLMSVLRKD